MIENTNYCEFRSSKHSETATKRERMRANEESDERGKNEQNDEALERRQKNANKDETQSIQTWTRKRQIIWIIALAVIAFVCYYHATTNGTKQRELMAAPLSMLPLTGHYSAQHEEVREKCIAAINEEITDGVLKCDGLEKEGNKCFIKEVSESGDLNHEFNKNRSECMKAVWNNFGACAKLFCFQIKQKDRISSLALETEEGKTNLIAHPTYNASF